MTTETASTKKTMPTSGPPSGTKPAVSIESTSFTPSFVEDTVSKKSFEELLGELNLPGVVVPIHYTQLQNKPEDYTSGIIGGKAFGLNKLLKYNNEKDVLVPKFWVIRCDKYTTPSDWLVVLNHIPKQGLYSVRSGAPISMPGMMTTKLNVPYGGLHEAVKEVWASYSSSHAVAYRENNGIDHSIGTAVIIQMMVPAKESGVAFTHDPNAPHKKTVYNPTISYVAGTGDGLVGGTAVETAMTDSHPQYSRLTSLFKKISAEHGPSDIEFALDNLGSIHLLQLRGVKFIDMDATSIQGSPEEADKVIVGGTSIGYPGKVALVVVDRLEDAKAGTALYVKEFTPETYEAMMKASAIICQIGGPHCHAGIVSRSSNKPAISGIPKYEIEQYVGQKIIIDGSTGCLFTIKSGTEVVSTVTETEMSHLIPVEERIPRLSIRSRSGSGSIYGDRLAARFYTVLASDSPQEVKDRLIKDIALACFSYGWLICLGEARHAPSHNLKDKAGTKLGSDGIKTLLSLGVEVNGGHSRSGLVNSIPQMNYENSVAAAKAAYHVFQDMNWIGGFGGPKWAVIADVVYKFIIGELNETLFLDRFFNLKHNNGTLFNKFNWFQFGSNMQGLLNIKQSGTADEFADYLQSNGLFEVATNDTLFLSIKDHALPVVTEENKYATTVKEEEFTDDDEEEEEEEFLDEEEEESEEE